MSEHLTVATTILEQLGGRRFMAMTGAKHFLALDEARGALRFKLPGKPGFVKKGINLVKITLMPSDTYTVTAYRYKGLEVTEVETHDDIYADVLRDVFTRMTGLAVSL